MCVQRTHPKFNYAVWYDIKHNAINPLLHRYSFLCLLQQMTFKNIVTKEEIAPAPAIFQAVRYNFIHFNIWIIKCKKKLQYDVLFQDEDNDDLYIE